MIRNHRRDSSLLASVAIAVAKRIGQENVRIVRENIPISSPHELPFDSVDRSHAKQPWFVGNLPTVDKIVPAVIRVYSSVCR